MFLVAEVAVLFEKGTDLFLVFFPFGLKVDRHVCITVRQRRGGSVVGDMDNVGVERL